VAAAVLDADDVVGRIIRFKKESSAGADFDKLCRDGCFFKAAGGGPREGLLVVLFRVDGFRGCLAAAVPLTRLGERGNPWLDCRLLTGCALPEARLSDCREGGDPEAVLEPEDAVCAINEAGSLTGLVGDLGFGFTKPVCGGDA